MRNPPATTGEAEFAWVFGYGSLMWKPGFPFLESQPARVDGYHRAFCIYSHYYRGTPACPGLVLGLAPSGDCLGLAFRIAPADRAAVKAYLDERELIGYAYRAVTHPVRIVARTVVAYMFVADQTHPLYAGEIPAERAAAIICDAEGVAGLNRDYLIETVRHLQREGFRDPPLDDLLRRVERITGVLEAGGGI